MKDTAVAADVGNQTPATDMADGSPAVYVVDAAMVADIGNQAADTDVALGPRLLIWKTNQLVR